MPGWVPSLPCSAWRKKFPLQIPALGTCGSLQAQSPAAVAWAPLQEPAKYQWHPLKGPALHTNPFTQISPHTDNSAGTDNSTINTALTQQITQTLLSRLEIRSRTDLESEEQILFCPIYNITDPVVDRTVKEPLLLQKIFPLGQEVHLYFFASS